ncbi:MAG: methyl-accepting chemotaxis protein [Pseudomonadota bacterium]
MNLLLSKATHSLITRLAVLLLTLGGLIAAVFLISWLVFQTIQENMSSFKMDRVPQLRASAGIISATDVTRSILLSAVIAQDLPSLEGQTKAAVAAFEDFRQALERVSPEERARLLPMVDETQAAVSRLLEARAKELTETANVLSAIKLASDNAGAASVLIAEANDNAFFDMTLSGEQTTESIDETLTRLVEENFYQFQVALSIRGEINLIAGLAIAFNQDDASQISSIIADLLRSAIGRLTVSLERNQDVPVFATALPVISESLQIFERVFGNQLNRPSSSEILEARLAVDTVLSPALDDIYFELIIANDDAKSTNQAALERLLQVDVERMRANASLDTATRSFFAALLQVAAAQTDGELNMRQSEVERIADDIMRLKAGTEFDAQANLLALVAFADPATGVRAKRAALLVAQAEATAATNDATLAVQTITEEATTYAEAALVGIEEAAGFLSGSVDTALSQLMAVAVFGAFVMLVVPVLVWVFVSRPIGRVTLVTERLASGDLSEIEGLPRNQGELGRLASALHVFRENALANIAMQEEERKREVEAAAAAKEAEELKRREEQRRVAEEEQRAQAKREDEAKIAAENEERQRKEFAEQNARMEEQELIVSSLAQGLNNLAAGDLTCKIDKVFPAAYDALRLDFNSAIDNLAEIVLQLKESSETIEGNCGELSSASADLASRTESNASTLTETVASVSSLSSSVAEAAENAGQASATIQSVREQANLNNEVMKKATSAMSRVQEASGKITSIVDIIDSIAFQTNLLALNAGVEAARAGDAGQGFAVVANEVRVLAQRCSDAASEIGTVVEESARTVHEGSEFTEKANEAMSAINEGIDEISTIVDGIARASAEQARGLSDVDQAVQNLDSSTQQNAAMFEETSASNQVLSTEAHRLSDVVKSFVVPTAETGETEYGLAS